jgi:hypothetical protein
MQISFKLLNGRLIELSRLASGKINPFMGKRLEEVL